jgi:hypothetical protein
VAPRARRPELFPGGPAAYVDRASQGAGLILGVRVREEVYRPEIPGLSNPVYRSRLDVGSELEIVLLAADAADCAELAPGVVVHLKKRSLCCDVMPMFGACLLKLQAFGQTRLGQTEP